MIRPGGAASVAITFVTLGLVYGVWYSYSVFLVALLREFGWSRTLLAGAFSTFTLVHGLLSLPLGWLGDRIGPRRLVLAGGALLAAGLFLDARIGAPWHLYVTFGVLTAIGVASAGWLPAVMLVQGWYERRVGTMIGVTSAGIGAGIFVVVPACQWLIEHAGWRGAYRTLAIVVAVWIVPATLLLVRDPPRRAGAAQIGGANAVPGDDITVRRAVRAPLFWLIVVAQMGGAFASQMLLVHQVAYLVDHGIASITAAAVVGVVGIASIVGKGVGGWFSDTFGRELTYTLGMACLAASVGALAVIALAPRPPWAYAYGLLVSIGYSVAAPLMPALINDRYRGRHFGAIFGMLYLCNSVGGSLGPWVAGRVFDTAGTYAPAFAAAVVSGAIGSAALWAARGRPTM
ncbi:MAG: MFS transporter [Candidatus Rokubacteria bacterium]|nr:MFS transporter [Candidatus Rokubacteria bacterium]